MLIIQDLALSHNVMYWHWSQFSSLFCHHPLTMGSISFRQGQKALACRLAHCVALTNDVAWKKTNQALLYLWCNIIVKPALIGSIFNLVMMKTRPWWWDQVGTLRHTTPYSAAPLLCPKIPGNRSGSGQRRQIERVRRLFCTCYFDLWGFELSICINLCLYSRGLCM